MTFRRLLANKYTGCNPCVNDYAKPQPSLWRVAGVFDLMEFKSIDKLSDAENIAIPYGPHEDYRWSIAYELPGAPTERTRNVCSLLETTDCPMCIISRITLAPPAHQFSQHGPADVRQALVNKIEELCSANNAADSTAVLGTLGSPDALVVLLARTPYELANGQSILTALRHFRLAALRNTIQAPAAAPDTPCPGSCCTVMPTFCYSSSSMRQFGEEEFRQQERRHRIRYRFQLTVEANSEGRVISALHEACASGTATGSPELHFDHDHPPAKEGSDPDSGLGAPRAGAALPARASWDAHVVRGWFNSLAAFNRAWEGVFFDPSWRTDCVIDSRTSPLVPSLAAPQSPAEADHDQSPAESADSPTSAEADQQWHWVVSHQLQAILASTEQSLVAFAEEFLNLPQRDQLLCSMHMFRASFSHPYLIPRARDLVPLFVNAGRLFGLRDRWAEYLRGAPRSEDTSVFNDFAIELEQFTEDVEAALRLRLDDRLDNEDLAIPVDYGSGTSRTLNAYTALVELCWSALRGEKGSELDDEGKQTGRFGVCVGIGTEGRVICREYFRQFRRFCEREASTREEIRRVPRLLSLHTARSTLVRPEVAIAHSCHEMAERTDWLQASGRDELRYKVNTWVFAYLSRALRSRTADVVTGEIEQPGIEPFMPAMAHKQIRADLRGFVYWYICFAVAKAEQHSPLDRPAPEAAREMARELCQQLSPAECLNKLYQALLATASESDTLRQYGDRFTPEGIRGISAERLQTVGGHNGILRPPLAAIVSQVVTYRGFRAELANFSRFFGDVIADSGTIFGLTQLLAIESGRAGDGRRLGCINRVFRSLLVHVLHAYRDPEIVMRIQRAVLRRWLVQAQAASIGRRNDASQSSLPGWQEVIGPELRKSMDDGEILEKTPMAELLKWANKHRLIHNASDPGSLVRHLSGFGPYGGSKGIALGVDLAVYEPVLQEFRAIWEGEQARMDVTGRRLRLIQLLWDRTTADFAGMAFAVAPRNGADEEKSASPGT